MNEVDDRIVNMRFNNSQFEQGARTTIATLSKLKQGLNLGGAASQLSQLQETSDKFSMAPLMNGIGEISHRFSAMGIIGVTALQNIANSAINTGRQMLKSLTVAPIHQGFQEYELKMGSIQTIMASTGESLATVNRYLEELNTYSDRTIYSFSDMTQNIGKFTNAGVKLHDAVKAIQGISNEAAVSGANANEASRAMYNFAQALSAGSVKLIDWKSIENANMATVEFKNNLIKTALELGTLRKEGDKYVSTTTNIQGKTSEAFTATRLFNESLNSQWMSTEVLVKTLGEYADETTDIGKKAFAAAQDVKTFSQLMDTLKEAVGSGWAQTWEILFGDLEEAKKLWSSVNQVMSKIIGVQSDMRNGILETWDSLGGRTTLIESLGNIFKGLGSLIVGVKESFREIFPAKTIEEIGTNLNAITDKFHRLSKDIQELVTPAGRLSDIGKKVANYHLLSFAQEFTGMTRDSIKELAELGATSGYTSQKFTDMLDTLSEGSDETGSKLTSVIKVINGDYANVYDLLSDVTGASSDTFKELHKVGEEFGYTSLQAQQMLAVISKGNPRIKQMIVELLHASNLNPVIDKLQRSFKGVFAILHIGKTIITNLVKTVTPFIASTAKASLSILDITAAIGDWLVALDESITKNEFFTKTFEMVGSVLEAGSKIIKMAFESIQRIVEAVWPKIISVFQPSNIKPIETIGSVFSWISDTIVAAVDKLAPLFSFFTDIVLDLGKGIGESVKFANLDSIFDIINGGLIAAIFSEIKNFVSSFGKVSGVLKQFKQVLVGWQESLQADALIKIGKAIAIITGSLFLLSLIDPSRLASGLAALTTIVGELFGAMAVFGKVNNKKSFAAITKIITMLNGLATALILLSGAVAIMGSMDPKKLTNGLIGIGVAMLELAGFMAIVGKVKFKRKSIKGIINLAIALNILAVAVKSFGSMGLETLGVGLGGVAVALLEVVGFVKLIGESSGGKFMAVSAGMILLSTAMVIMTKAVKELGSTPIFELVGGLLAMGTAIFMLTTALNFMPPDTIAKGAGLLIISIALNALAKALASMGKMKMSEIGKALLVLGGALAEIAIAMKFMVVALPGAAALLIVSNALISLAVVLKILGSMSMKEIGKAFLALGGSFVVLGLASIIALPAIPFILALAGAVALLGAATSLIGTGILALASGLALLATSGIAVGTAISAVLTAVANAIPLLIVKLAEGIVTAIGVLATSIPVVVEAIISLINALLMAMLENVPKFTVTAMQLLAGFLYGIAANLGAVIDSATDVIVNFIDGIARSLPRIIDSGFNLLVSFIQGIADAVDKRSEDLFDAMWDLAGNMITGLVKGIMDGIKRAVDAAVELAKSIWGAVKEFFGIHSPSRKMKWIGEQLCAGLSNGITENGGDPEDAAKKIGADTANAMYTALQDVIDSEGNPVITPVIDLSNARNELKTLNGLVSANQEMDISAINGTIKAGRISGGQNGENVSNITNFNFTQNNTSPKALSRLDIYRQTKNQLSAIKGLART